MSKVVVLGGSGVVGSVAVRTLAKHPAISEVVIADYNLEAANHLMTKLQSNKVTAAHCDVLDQALLSKTLHGCDVVLNCVGPFYNTVKSVLEVVVKEKINYVDICDDVDVTLEILDMDQIFKQSGVKVLLGMGSSPGVTNIIAKFAADQLLDEVESIDIFHTHGGEPVEGPGVIGHRFHCMSISIPMFLDGSLKHVNFFEEDGIALRQTFNFPLVGETMLYPYPHPEQVTIPKYINLKQVTNKGSVLPDVYYNLIKDLCQLGLNDNNPVVVKGHKVTPSDFAIAYIIRERERILKETNFGSQRGCASVIVKGKKNQAFCEYRFHMASTSQALGEGTGIPAGFGAILMAEGKIKGEGVMPPEACVEPQLFLDGVIDIMKKDAEEKNTSFKGLIIEEIREDGMPRQIDLESLRG
jgi:saccharopine dehydrogenase (NAD+, L-lysine forming)